MAKIKKKWICQKCGYESFVELGKCPECNAWGTLTEELFEKHPSTLTKGIYGRTDAHPTYLHDITEETNSRISSGFTELDQLLGKGLVIGSVLLISGDPGIGKSTLLIQISNLVSIKTGKVLYISAEESAQQLKIRANRLGIVSENLMILADNNIQNIQRHIQEHKPILVILDSIQTVYDPELNSIAGSVSQVRECCNIITDIAKTLNITTIIVGHVTKEGTIAGPKVLEHMVDVVLYFEGDKFKNYRLLRSIKNRYGNTNDVAVFSMDSDGLNEVTNPSEMFLSKECHSDTPGSVIVATCEGSKTLLVEIQALTGITTYPSPRRVCNGIDYNRLLQIIAILERRVGLALSKHDVYVNVVGGINITEPSADLGVALAIISCLKNIPIKSKTVIMGELGLLGEVRAVTHAENRIRESAKLNFEHILLPAHNFPEDPSYKIQLLSVTKIMDALQISFHPS